MLSTMLTQVVAMRRNVRSWTFINCWTSSPTESIAMWRLYVGDGNGLAIESSYDRLVAAVAGEKPVYMSPVKYADWRQGLIPENNTLAPFLYKRAGFDYERELRAIIQELPTTELGIDWSQAPPPGLVVPVDVRQLVLRVRLSPVAEHWYHEVVQSVIAKYGYDIEVSQSDLAGEPVY
jgi:hypothetical protein